MKNLAQEFDPSTNQNINSWLNGEYDEDTKRKIRNLLDSDPKEILDSFYTNLRFGTGGLRGVMGVGCNRMNVYTVRTVTQGLADYLNLHPKSNGHSVFIGFDSRNHSREFAEEAAKVLAANHIQVYLCKELRPTPLISFGCRYKKCSAAIVITASHNPPQYNGYKIYWDDGAQVLHPHDQGIIDQIDLIKDVKKIKVAPSLNHPRITLIGEELDREYIEAISSLQLSPEQNQQHGAELKIVYTSLHGTGITLIPQTLNRWGFKHVELVKDQIMPDGNFSTVASPNPEDKASLAMGIETLIRTNGDLLIATDPDADRVGIAVKHQNQIRLLDGNQIACICLEYICKALSEQKKLPERAAFVKTIGTTELFAEIAKAYGKTCFNVLTGFKHIAEKIREWEGSREGYEFVFAGEESFGYLLGTKTRDKDAIIASALISEIALHAKLQKKTLIDLLHDLWHKYGIYVEKLQSLKFDEGREGKEQMGQKMSKLRKNPPKSIHGMGVVCMEDYASSKKTELTTGKTSSINLPCSNALLFWLEDNSKLMIRPSGTEPIIKLYCGVVNHDFKTIEEGQKAAEQHAENLLKDLQSLLRL